MGRQADFDAHLCDFQTQVIGAGISNRTVTAPKSYPSILDGSDLPVFINLPGDFNPSRGSSTQYNYSGSYEMRLYLYIAGQELPAKAKYEALTYCDVILQAFRRNERLELSDGSAFNGLVRPVEITRYTPFAPNLRYGGSSGQLFAGCTFQLSVTFQEDRC